MEFEDYKITDFNISFDGIYWLKFKKDGKKFEKAIPLTYNQLNTLISKEGICVDKMDDLAWYSEGVTFKKTTIILYGDDNSGFLTAELSERYQDVNIFFLEVGIEK